MNPSFIKLLGWAVQHLERFQKFHSGQLKIIHSVTSSQTKHCVVDSDSVDADIHAVGSDAE